MFIPQIITDNEIVCLGCDCNYDLSASQRNGDYEKWKFFDHCLYNAIQKLSVQERGIYQVYSGLTGVKMDKKVVKNRYFATYVSTSWRKEVSEQFVAGEGMIIHIDEEYRDTLNCCDVSWISKFPDECEILFSRSTGQYGGFSCVILDQVGGLQTISLKRMKSYKIDESFRFGGERAAAAELEQLLNEMRSMV